MKATFGDKIWWRDFPISSLSSFKIIHFHFTRKTERQRSSICWFTPTNAHNNQGWTRPKPGAQNPIWISHMGGKDPNLWAIPSASQEAELQVEELGLASTDAGQRQLSLGCGVKGFSHYLFLRVNPVFMLLVFPWPGPVTWDCVPAECPVGGFQMPEESPLTSKEMPWLMWGHSGDPEIHTDKAGHGSEVNVPWSLNAPRLWL